MLQGERQEQRQPRNPTPPSYEQQEEREIVKDEKASSKLERDYFNAEPTESSIGKTNELVLMSDSDLEIEMENDLTLLNSIETKE